MTYQQESFHWRKLVAGAQCTASLNIIIVITFCQLVRPEGTVCRVTPKSEFIRVLFTDSTNNYFNSQVISQKNYSTFFPNCHSERSLNENR